MTMYRGLVQGAVFASIYGGVGGFSTSLPLASSLYPKGLVARHPDIPATSSSQARVGPRHRATKLHFWNLPFFSTTETEDSKPGTTEEVTAAERFFRFYFEEGNVAAALECLEGSNPGGGDEQVDSSQVNAAASSASTNMKACEFMHASFPKVFQGKDEIERYLRLRLVGQADLKVTVQNVVVGSESNVGIYFTERKADTGDTCQGVAFFDLNPRTGLVQSVYWVQETSNAKGGETNLRVLGIVSKFVGQKKGVPTSSSSSASSESTSSEPTIGNKGMSFPEQYFDAWNRRDMKQAVSLFADDVVYDDTAFPAPFSGKAALKKHLDLCAELLPSTFTFELDDIAQQTLGSSRSKQQTAVTKWHVENSGKPMPFSSGCSYYETDQSGQIERGVDIVEPPLFKTGGLDLFQNTVRNYLTNDPKRWIPLLVWITYMYVVFLSDWFFGLPATAMEQRTWIEVKDLSLNFFLVSPILNLPFSPVVHPMLEGTFNLLLSWAALFAGFLSDDRKDKPNIFPMLPAVAGMQFLTSAFLLPYLVLRSTEDECQNGGLENSSDEVVGLSMVDSTAGLSTPAKLVEGPVLGALLGGVGTGSIFWAIFARQDLFGGWSERSATFLELLSIDRVGSSFLVDLAIFAAFQGWLVDDDCKRRGMTNDADKLIITLAKYVPFFGLATYMIIRKPIG